MVLLTLLIAAALAVGSSVVRVSAAALFLPAYALFVWRYALNDGDKQLMMRLRARFVGGIS
jgi:hypothetical protein